MHNFDYVNAEGKMVRGTAALLHAVSCAGGIDKFINNICEAAIKSFLESKEGMETIMMLANAYNTRKNIKLNKCA